MSAVQCAFSHDPERVPPAYRGFNCRREAWDGHHTCVLHAELDEKPLPPVLDALRDEHPIDGAYLPVDLSSELEAWPERARSARWARFPGANLDRISFHGTDLRGAEFSHASLDGVLFRGANLWGAKFPNSSMQATAFVEAFLWGATFHNAHLMGVKFHQSDISQGHFIGAFLGGAEFRDAILNEVELSYAYLRRARFSDSSLHNAKLRNADLLGARFADTELHNTNFQVCNLEEVIFLRSDISGADFSQARLDGTIFRHTTVDIRTRFGGHHETQQAWIAAERSYRTVRQLAQENALPELQSKMHYAANDAARKRYRTEGPWFRWLLAEANRMVMGYGERPWRVVTTAAFVFIVAALAYPILGLEASGVGARGSYPVSIDAGLEAWASALWDGLYFSAVTFTTVGYGDLQPDGFWSELLAAVETLLGAMLTALLVFVLGRRAVR